MIKKKNLNRKKLLISHLVFETWGHYNFLTKDSSNYGRFYQCNDFKHDDIEGNFCTVIIDALNTNETASGSLNFEFSRIIHDSLSGSQIKTSICAPKACSSLELQVLGNKLLAHVDFKWSYLSCYKQQNLARRDSDTFTMQV